MGCFYFKFPINCKNRAKVTAKILKRNLFVNPHVKTIGNEQFSIAALLKF